MLIDAVRRIQIQTAPAQRKEAHSARDSTVIANQCAAQPQAAPSTTESSQAVS
jgi:hypothetical protein